YRVAVSQDNFRRVSGTASFALALSNIQRVEISMQQTTSQEMNGIDNFTLIGDLSPGAPSTVPATPVVSSFDNDTDGWGRDYPPAGVTGSTFGDSCSTLSFTSDGGNPGGAIVLNEAGAAADDFFVAPPKFLGNLAAIPNPVLEFDYKHVVARPRLLVPMIVRLLGAGSVFQLSGGFPSS